MTVELQNGFDPTAWHDNFTGRLTPFTYLLCGRREMDDCLIWAIWRSIRGEPSLSSKAASDNL